MTQVINNILGDWGDPGVVSGLAPILEGDLIIATSSERAGGDATDHQMQEAGFTKHVLSTTQQGDENHRRSMAVFSKVAGPSEPTTFTVDDNTSNAKRLSIVTYRLEAGEDQFTYLDSDQNDDGATLNGFSLNVGTYNAADNTPLLLIGIGVVKNGGYAWNGASSWTDGFTSDLHDHAGWVSTHMQHFVGSKNDDTAGAKTTTFSYPDESNDSYGLNGAILAFKVGEPAANVAPVADDDTFSVQEDVTNGATVGTYTATDSDGTIVSYTITGTALAIDNSGVITIADNTGFAAGGSVVATVTATDDDGATDTATITVNITAIPMSASIDNASPEDGDTVTITIANGTGPYGVSFGTESDDLSAWIASQNSGQIVLNWGDIKTTHGQYNVLQDLVVTDTSDSSTDTVQVTPQVLTGEYYSDTFQMTGIHSYTQGAEVADNTYARVASGSFDSIDLEHGALNSTAGGVLEVWYQDETDWVWSGPFDHTLPAASIDTTPDQFDLGADVIDAEPSAITQRQFTITGIDAGQTVNISAIGAATVNAATGQLNDVITVTLQASAAFGGISAGGASIGSISDTFSITTRSAVAPTVSIQPANDTVIEGQNANFTAAFNNAVSYQWYDASDDSVIAGATNASYSFAAALGDNGNSYYCIATSADGLTVQTNTVSLTVNAAASDTTPPVITLNGSSSMTWEQGSAWNDPGAIVTDNTDANRTISADSPPDVNTLGAQVISYNTQDAAGNNAVTVTRTVTIVEEIAYPIAVEAPNSRTYVAERINRIEMGEAVFFKQPEEILDYDIDLDAWLTEQGDALPADNYSFTVEGGLTVVESGVVPNSNRVKVWLSGGEPGNYGEAYLVELTIITAGYRTAQFSFRLVVIDRE